MSEEDWEDQTQYDGFEVNREEDRVYLIFSAIDGETQMFDLHPDDAATLAIALALAAQSPEESTSGEHPADD